MSIPSGLSGLRHLALNVTNLAAMLEFYQGILGMRIVWQPDPENVYLSGGCDNLALHQVARTSAGPAETSRLDHLGFIVRDERALEAWHDHVRSADVPVIKPLRRHRDGSVSFYATDPEGNVIQFLFEPQISPMRISS